MIKRAEIEITAQNLWFLERYLNVFDFADLFPMDALADEGQRGVPITFHTDRGFQIVSDIDRPKMQLRNRSKHHGWTRWTTEVGLQPGDRLVIEKVGDREYSLTIERRANIA